MGQELLVEYIDAGEKLVSEFTKLYPVSVHFWVNPAESDRWYLYVAADNIGGNISSGYREVSRLLRSGNQWLDPFQIKLVKTSDPVARAAAQIRDRFLNSPSGTHYRGPMLGDVGIDSAYIYPSLIKANAVP